MLFYFIIFELSMKSFNCVWLKNRVTNRVLNWWVELPAKVEPHWLPLGCGERTSLLHSESDSLRVRVPAVSDKFSTFPRKTQKKDGSGKNYPHPDTCTDRLTSRVRAVIRFFRTYLIIFMSNRNSCLKYLSLGFETKSPFDIVPTSLTI